MHQILSATHAIPQPRNTPGRRLTNFRKIMPLLCTHFLPHRRHFLAVPIPGTELNQLRPSFDLTYLLLLLFSTDLKTGISYCMAAHVVGDQILAKTLHTYKII